MEPSQDDVSLGIPANIDQFFVGEGFKPIVA